MNEFLDQNGTVLPDIMDFLQIYAAFPNCQASRDQCHYILDSERTRYNSLPEGDFQWSKVTSVILEMIDGAKGRRLVCGYVALALITPTSDGVERSLNNAVSLASEEVKRDPNPQVMWYSTLGREAELKKRKVPADHRQIIRAVEEFGSVSHLCAAAIAMFDSIEHLHFQYPFDYSPEVSKYFLRTIAYYEKELLATSRGRKFELLPIAKFLPDNIMNLEPIKVPEDILRNACG